MVLHKRRSCPTPIQVALPYGDSRDSPIYNSFKKSGNSLYKSTSLSSCILKCITGVLAISWCVAIYWNYQMSASLKSLQLHHQIEILQYEEAKRTIEEASGYQKMLERHVQTMEQKQQGLEHELRVASELKEGETLGAFHNSISDVIERRQAVLQDKVESLRAYIQEESRREVLEKFGPGPHRVKLTVNITGTNEEKTIVLEMAPMDLMPHSVHLFLELVSHKMWDNTVFWHHANVPHLVAATVIDYNTGEPRKQDLEQMRLAGVSFAEHSKSYPHEKYTVGFARRGPNFYINTMDNSETHGPGGQAHYELADEADPCFAKVVEGHDVVDTLSSLSLAETKSKREKLNWFDETLTQIVRAEIL